MDEQLEIPATIKFSIPFEKITSIIPLEMFTPRQTDEDDIVTTDITQTCKEGHDEDMKKDNPGHSQAPQTQRPGVLEGRRRGRRRLPSPAQGRRGGRKD